MPSRDRAPAVQGRGTQAAAVADARASLRRTRARMASLTAYDKDISSGSYNLSSATTGSYYSCVSQVTIGYDAAGPVAIGLTHWKNPYAQGRPTLPSDLPLFISKDAGVPVYHQSLTRKTELATPLSCPASLSITPVPSYSSSSQETLSQDTTASSSFLSIFGGLSSYNIAFTSYISDFYLSLFSLTHKHLVYVKLITDFVSPSYNALPSICPVTIKVFQCG
ncbi:hypothetical protein MG293_002840 [Ovis ammon polii]|uniref:Uncharacterized protein n=1 Tax=Ovis ammon polii TaxID=230172 RepID=A0AAD4ULQ6_OVIAM|nr:hypothetical protein MG293_002840 [Ovis ammon polii]KAI4576527.1 hypothetical protein MJT46_002362 [Ovis ammon polii x Ovis aries]